MRTIRTFVLRLMADTEEPEQLRGSVRSVSNDAEYPFTDAQALLTVLVELSSSADFHAEPTRHQREPGDSAR